MAATVRKCALGLGVVVALATWVILVAQAPIAWDRSQVGTLQYLQPLVGFAISAVLLFIASRAPWQPRMALHILGAVAANSLVGEAVGHLKLPIYLDSIFTIVIGIAYGPVAGMSTGLLTNVAWGSLHPSLVFFSLGSAVVGFLSGALARVGGFRKWLNAGMSGFLVGIAAALLAAPVAVLVFATKDFGGTSALVATIMENGMNLVSSAVLQSLLSDPIDKALSALLAFVFLHSVVPLLETRGNKISLICSAPSGVAMSLSSVDKP